MSILTIFVLFKRRELHPLKVWCCNFAHLIGSFFCSCVFFFVLFCCFFFVFFLFFFGGGGSCFFVFFIVGRSWLPINVNCVVNFDYCLPVDKGKGYFHTMFNNHFG